MGGGGGEYAGGAGMSSKSVGREARGTTGGAPDAMTSGRDLDGGGGGPLVDARGKVPAGGGGARFQLGSQLTLEAGMLEYRSRVLVTLATLTSLAFSALAFSSATGSGRTRGSLRSERGRGVTPAYNLPLFLTCGVIKRRVGGNEEARR